MKKKTQYWIAHTLLLTLMGSGLSGIAQAQTSETLNVRPAEISMYPGHKGYVGRYKAYRCKQQGRHSEELAFNPVRKALLLELLFAQSKHHDLIDDEIRFALRNQAVLPPGDQRQLAPGTQIPPRLTDKVLILPQPVNHFLGFRKQADLKIGILGDDILLYDPKTQLIHDVLRNIL